MPKKPRSQRRGNKQGGGGDTEIDDGRSELPEDYTIAGSITSAISAWDDSDSNNNNNDDHDDDDLIGNVSERGMLAAASREAKLRETLSLLDEFATEKRSATRETRLRRIFKALSQYVTGYTSTEIVLGVQDELRTACLYSLRAGSSSEMYSACRVLEATAVVFQGDQDEWIASIEKQLHRTVQITSRATLVRAAALRAWSMSVFIGASEIEATHALLDVCEDVAQPTYRNEIVPPILRSTAIDCWSLLATTLSEYAVAGNDDVSHGRGLTLLPLLKDCLENEGSSDLRASAGECVALVHECRIHLKDDSAENTTEKMYQQASWEGTDWEVIMDEISQRVSELAVQSGHHMSKKAKKAQRATFREYMATILDDESPEEAVSMRNEGSLTLTTWREIVQLGFIRSSLQSGFQVQLMTNETLQIMFGVQGGVKADGLSSLEKRLYMSKASDAAKEADLKLTKKRDKREQVKNHFLTVDGDDL